VQQSEPAIAQRHDPSGTSESDQTELSKNDFCRPLAVGIPIQNEINPNCDKDHSEKGSQFLTIRGMLLPAD
jgi:hypothetical protein